MRQEQELQRQAHSRAAVLNAFRPSGEMEVPSGFAGRRKQVLELVDALYSSGTCPIIYPKRARSPHFNQSVLNRTIKRPPEWRC